MAAQSFADLKTTLNLRIGDTDDFTFTDVEKSQALTEAFNDPLVTKPIWDSTLAFVYGTYQYTKPTGVDVVQDIYTRAPGDTISEPKQIDSKLWEVVDGNIQFKNEADNYIAEGCTLFIKGKTKYTVDDSIAETNVQEYILNLAVFNLLGMLGHKKVFKFLKNDTSVSEAIAIKREAERHVQEYRRRMPRQFESA